VGGVITGSSASVTGTVTAASTVGGVITGTSSSMTGNITGGNLTINTNATILGNLQVQGNVTFINSNAVVVNDLFLELANNQSSLSSVNGAGLNVGPNGAPLTNWTYSTGANAWSTNVGVSVAGTVTAASTVGGVITGSSASVSGTVTAASTVGGVITGSSVSVSGTVTTSGETVSGTITVNSSNNATAIANGGSNGGGNIGASGATFNTVFAKATTAQYADLAENYAADAEYTPGTVLVFGGTAEVTVNAVDADTRVAGVVSTNPGFLMNEGLDSEFVAAVALTGRVPCMIIGPVAKGDMLVAAGLGRARAEANPRVGSVIGKALEDFDGAEGTIEVVIGRF
jgi:cytoskeletal protein CcmA (bactofilin family)